MLPLVEKIGTVISESNEILETDKDIHINIQVINLTCGDFFDYFISDCCRRSDVLEDNLEENRDS